MARGAEGRRKTGKKEAERDGKGEKMEKRVVCVLRGEKFL